MKFTTHVWTHDIFQSITGERSKFIAEGFPLAGANVLSAIRDINSFFAEIMPGGTTYQSATDLQKSAFDLMSETLREVGFPWKVEDVTLVGNRDTHIVLHEENHKAFLYWPEDNIWELWGVRAYYKDYPPVYKIFRYAETGQGQPGDTEFYYDWSC